MNDHNQQAAFYLSLFESFMERVEEINPKRYNKEFMEAYKPGSETTPTVLMFNAFVAGVDMGGGKSLKSSTQWKTPLPKTDKGVGIAEAIPALQLNYSIKPAMAQQTK